MFISPAFAQDGAAGPGPWGQILFFVAIFAVFYFLLIRPQQKRMKQHKEMVASVRRGDIVVTGGGIIGKISRIEGGDELTVEIADGVKVKVIASTLADVRSKTEPAKSDNDNDGDDK